MKGNICKTSMEDEDTGEEIQMASLECPPDPVAVGKFLL